MTLFDLLFLASVIALLIALVRLVYILLRRQNARPLALRILICTGVYFVALLTVSLFSAPRTYTPGEPQCFDDWCIAITGAESVDGALCVHLAVTSQARRVTQREFGVKLLLFDNRGRRYLPDSEFGVPIDTAIPAGGRFETGRIFHPVSDARGLFVIVEHGGPGMAIIADRNSLLHAKSRMLLPDIQARARVSTIDLL